MFNNVILDVFIGLVLLYLLYSLLMTVVSEVLAGWFNLRPRILRLSIEKMLNDGYFPPTPPPASFPKIHPRLWSWTGNTSRILQRFFLKEFPHFKESFAARFYAMPSIKYLTSGAGEPRTFFTQTKPSYISPDNFADSLITLLAEEGSGTERMDQVHFTLRHNTAHIRPGSLKRLRDLAESAGPNLPVFREKLIAWYNETQDRATGWYKRKIRLMLFWLGFLLAAILNIDSISIAKILAKDKEARRQMVAMGVSAAKDSARYGGYRNHDAAPSAVQSIFDSSFSQVNRDIHDASLVLGLGWNTRSLEKKHSFAVDTTDKNYAELSIVASGGYLSAREKLNNLSREYSRRIDSMRLTESNLVNDRIDSLVNSGASYSSKRDSLLHLQEVLRARNESAIISSNMLKAELKKIDSVANAAAGGDFRMIGSIQLVEGKVYITGTRAYRWYEKLGHVIGRVMRFEGFWGFVITGLMISLGAPFWFDLLKKLVSLRSAGVKPADKKVDNISRDTVHAALEPFVLTPVPATDHVQLALERLTRLMMDEPGLVAIGIEYEAGGEPCLSVLAESEEVKSFLENKFGKSMAEGVLEIPVRYATDSEIIVQVAAAGSEIANETKALGSGTLGCHLRRKGSDDLYFLSCWHVVKDNANWDMAPVYKNVITGEKKLGAIEKGFLSYHPHTGMDAGIAKYFNSSEAGINPAFVIKGQHRAVTSQDFALSTPVVLAGKVSGIRRASIFHNKINARVKYPDGRVYLMNDVFSISSRDEHGNRVPPTMQGDSGAIVIDEKGLPLGMVIGGSGNLSFAIKFSNLFDPGKPFKDFYFHIHPEV